MAICNKECEVYSRIVGYFRPVQRWNKGKAEEYKMRKTFSEKKAFEKKFKGEKDENRTNKRNLVNVARS